MKKLLLLFIIFTCQFTFAVDLPPNNSWSWKHHEKMREQARLKARLVKQINESGSSKTISAIVETKPTPSKVGGSMLKRISHVAKTPGVQLIGVLAVTELLEGIGWVMKDGSYVKFKYDSDYQIPQDLYLYEYRKRDGVTYAPLNDVLTEWETVIKKRVSGSFAVDEVKITSFSYTNPSTVTIKYDTRYCTSSCSPTVAYTYGDPWRYNNTATFYGVYKGTPPEPTEIPLTAPVLGAAMLGQGYNDPVDPDRYNNQVNTDQWTGVPDSYTPDDSGIGNELAEELENKADNAPQTPDGKESSLTDSKYSNDLSSNDNANDRSWQSGDGTEGSTDSTQTTDPETGTTSNTGTFKLPAFCDWAMTMCQWYDDWTSSDKVQKDHMTKTEEHQKDEKSFWEWFQKDDVSNNEEDSEVQDDDQLPELSTNTFNFGGMCPSDINLPIPDPFGHTNNLTLSFQTFCLWLTKLNPWIDVLGWIIAITILTGQRSANNEQ